jgi:hypothetical protein
LIYTLSASLSDLVWQPPVPRTSPEFQYPNLFTEKKFAFSEKPRPPDAIENLTAGGLFRYSISLLSCWIGKGKNTPKSPDEAQALSEMTS